MVEVDFLKPENRFRATPLDLLKQGVEKRQWEAVDICYLMLTGNTVTPPVEPIPPKRKAGRPKKVKVEPIVDTLETNIATEAIQKTNKEVIQELGVPTDCIAPATKGKHTVPSRRQSITERKHTNKWKDDLSEAQDEIIKDRKVPDSILNNRRPDMPWITVKCSDCGQIAKIEPGSFLYGGKLTKNYSMKWKCNDCICGVARSNSSDDSDDDILEDDDG